MKEIEIKILDVNKAELEKKLLGLGAKLVGKYELESIVFDTPNKDLNSKKELLRLRKKNAISTLTHKSSVKEDKTRTCEETEVEVGDFEKTKALLIGLGFICSSTKPKKRTTYKLNNSLIEIDEYKEIPTFFEVESPNEKELEEIVKLLGYSMKDTKTWTGWKVFNHYGKELESAENVKH